MYSIMPQPNSNPFKPKYKKRKVNKFRKWPELFFFDYLLELRGAHTFLKDFYMYIEH
jgi:hypothetical protein